MTRVDHATGHTRWSGRDALGRRRDPHALMRTIVASEAPAGLPSPAMQAFTSSCALPLS
jgi:hypothetical protein